MRILYIHRTQGIGAEGAHIMGMVEAFRDLGHDTTMHCLPGCDPFERQQRAGADRPPSNAPAPARPGLVKRLYWLVAEHCPQPVFEVLELLYNIPLTFSLAARFLRFRPELVYERYSLNTCAGTLVSRIFGIPHVLEVNDSVVIERSRPLVFTGIASILEGLCIRGSVLSITITDKFKAGLVERFRVDAGKILVLTNGISVRRFGGPFDKPGLRRTFAERQGKGRILIGGAGQFLDWHGLRELVETLAPEMERLDLGFLFIGDGPSREPVEARAAALGVRDRVRFTGMLPITEVPAQLALLDIAVIPNAAPHASPMKLMEYMAMGLPIVAPDLPSIRAALTESTGCIFPRNDWSAMKDRILDLASNPAAASALGAAAREYVFGELTWTSHAERVLERLEPSAGIPAASRTPSGSRVRDAI